MLHWENNNNCNLDQSNLYYHLSEPNVIQKWRIPSIDSAYKKLYLMSRESQKYNL